MKVGSLFAGIGGFDLAARWMGWETIWFSEIDPYCQAVLAKHWPGVPQLGDITQVDWSTVERPDLLCGGFPCQPHSVAGKRKGGGDSRDLWGEFVRAIRDLRPRYVVAENVPGLLTSNGGLFFNRVLSDLAALGYDAEWQCLPAGAVGADHLRDRLFLAAYPVQSGLSIRGAPRANQGDARFLGAGFRPAERNPLARVEYGDSSDVRRDVHGIPRRVDRIRGLGNAIYPKCALEIFRAIEAQERVAA